MLKLSVVTPLKKIMTEAPVEEVFVPAQRGELNILQGHAPLLSTLQTGILKYRLATDKTLNEIAISSGFIEVSNDRVIVLAETAEGREEIDVTRATDAKGRAEKALLASDASPEDIRKYQLKLNRAMIRLQVAKNTSSH